MTRTSRQRQSGNGLGGYKKALSNPGVRLGYALSLAGVAAGAAAVWLDGRGGTVLFAAPASILAVTIYNHLLVARRPRPSKQRTALRRGES